MRNFIHIVIDLIIITLFIVIMSSYVIAAGVVDTPHDTTHLQHDIGVCSSCHPPVGMEFMVLETINGLGINPNRDIGSEGVVGNLCLTCHSSVSLGSTVFIEASFSEKYVFPGVGIGKESHGLRFDGTFKEGTIKNPELPYSRITDYEGKILEKIVYECTTCHNVHDNQTNRPFLRANIKELCTMCHEVDAAHTGGVEAEVVKDGEESFISFTWSEGIDIKTAQFKLLPFDDPDGATDASWGDGKGRWNLGLHLAADVKKVERIDHSFNDNPFWGIKDGIPGTGLEGEITCVTCHAVHGVQDDSDANTPIDIPREKLIIKPAK